MGNIIYWPFVPLIVSKYGVTKKNFWDFQIKEYSYEIILRGEEYGLQLD